jgi:hypothetical protein
MDETERRRLKRTTVQHPGKVLIPGDDVQPCTVLNLTGLGVCIEVSVDASQLPQTLDFSVDNFHTTHRCKVVWHQDRLAGIQFERAEPPAARQAGTRAMLRLAR